MKLSKVKISSPISTYHSIEHRVISAAVDQQSVCRVLIAEGGNV